METLKLEVKQNPNYTAPHYSPQDVEGIVEFEGKIIDSHVHSNEGWLRHDWGFDSNNRYHIEGISKLFPDKIIVLEYYSPVLSETFTITHDPSINLKTGNKE